MKGKLIVIEGLDGSGKSTQENLLKEKLTKIGINVNFIKLPNYDDPACEPVKMYLSGRFGKKAGDVNAYAASTFFAVDRYVSYNCYWKNKYLNGDIFLADRYTTSNMIHQGSKFLSLKSKDVYLNWLWEYEFEKMALPVPDAVLFMDMPPESSIKLMEKRLNKITGEDKKDIHENDKMHLYKSYENAQYIAKKYDWKKISCVKNDEIRGIDEIAEEVFLTCKNSVKGLI